MNNEEQKYTALEHAEGKLTKKTDKLVTKIVRTDDPQELQDLTHLFNLAQTKKAVLRTQTYNELLDGITEQMKERVTKRADQFSHKDLLDYMNTITAAAEKASKQINTVDTTPIIQMNTQNNTVIVGESMDRESRQRVMDTVSALLAKMGIEQPADLVPENEVFETNLEETEEISNTADETAEITETTSVLNIDESFEPVEDSGEIHFDSEDDF